MHYCFENIYSFISTLSKIKKIYLYTLLLLYNNNNKVIYENPPVFFKVNVNVMFD